MEEETMNISHSGISKDDNFLSSVRERGHIFNYRRIRNPDS
jgi:hypothetical protein